MWRWACALALFCASLLDADAFKRAEMSASPFLLSSRYGRSPPRMLTPRNDRFFMSGRYGKRSEVLEDGLDMLPDTQTQREKEKEDREKWRPCDCESYVKAWKSFYKRNPETVENSSLEEE